MEEDMLAIECVEEIGSVLGQAIAGLNKFSKLGKKGGPIGAFMLSRSHLLGLL